MNQSIFFVGALVFVLTIKNIYGHEKESCGGPAASIFEFSDSNDEDNESNTCSENSQESNTLVTGYGVPVGSTASLTVGPRGPILLQDSILIDIIDNFGQERIPERVVHAKGAGAFGYFECTHDIRNYTKSSVFSEIGKKTAIAVRFSTAGGESGSADTVRDLRGFAVKFYTEDGIWDLVGNNTPIFFIRDPILLPSLIHSVKRNPATHLHDPNMFWDFISSRPETTHQVMLLFSDRGIPNGYRYMNGFGSNTFKMVNENDEAFWCKFHFKPVQGIKNLSDEKAAKLAPDYSIRDLYDAIAKADYPAWIMYIQIMTLEEAKTYKFNPFDVTKVWLHADFPLIQVGKIVLNQNPKNYFADVEQIAFAPHHMIPGIEPSPDKLLQGRLIAYNGSQRHRLGPNHLQLPVNCPYRVNVTNYQRDGGQAFYNQRDALNYFPNSYGGPMPNPKSKNIPFEVEGIVDRYESDNEQDFEQPRQFWNNVLNEDERTRLAQTIAGHLKGAADFIQERAMKNFFMVDSQLGEKIKKGLKTKTVTKKKVNIVYKKNRGARTVTV